MTKNEDRRFWSHSYTPQLLSHLSIFNKMGSNFIFKGIFHVSNEILQYFWYLYADWSILYLKMMTKSRIRYSM